MSITISHCLTNCTLLLCAVFWNYPTSFCQDRKINEAYEKALSELDSMLQGTKQLSFKRAVFVTENTYLDEKLDYEEYNRHIKRLANLAKGWMEFNPLKDYKQADSANLLKNKALFRLLKDTICIEIVSQKKTLSHLPYKYDFTDFFAKNDWTKMFVTKLMETHSGNCHSLPYFYKILADEIGATCWLSFAPNHIYIKNRCEGIGWYNTELTSGQFPIDAWITASGYISLNAIRSGIYMDTLSNRQAIAQCVLDLAKGYERKTGNTTDSFLIRCCDLVLKYHPMNIGAAIYKADILRKQFQSAKEVQSEQTQKLYKEIEVLYVRILKAGYVEMPEKMYQDWLQSVNKEKKKFSDQRLIRVL